MRLGKRLSADFFAAPAQVVAPALLGCILIRRLDGAETLAGRIVEVEAYLGDGSDPSSHSHAGITPRNASMFGPPGRLYAYRSYGIHICINIVCESEGRGAAILLRAVEPLQGIDTMRRRRGLEENARGPLIASGPGRLGQAFAFGLEDDGSSAISGAVRIHGLPPNRPPPDIRAGPRVGISRATELPYRFFTANDPWVSGKRNGERIPAIRLQAQKSRT